MKEKLLPTLLAGALLLATGCSQDSYQKGEGKYSLMQADLVEAFTTSSATIERVTTDDGEELRLETPYSDSWASRPDSVYRAVLYYNKVETSGSETVARVVRLGQVLTPSIRQPAYFKEGVKTDPVRVESVWLSRSGKYLNMTLLLMTGSSSDYEQKRHVIGMATDTTLAHADGTATCCLRLYHNQAGVPQNYTQRTVVSVPMTGVKADSVQLTINTYEGPVRHTLKLGKR